MYQPKIREELIPRLYRMAKARRMPMTRVLSELVEAAVDKFEGVEGVSEPAADYQASRNAEPTQRRKGRKPFSKPELQGSRWRRALGIAKVLFADQGYHTRYLEEIEAFLNAHAHRIAEPSGEGKGGEGWGTADAIA